MGKKALPVKWEFRDVSSGLQTLRNFLLGRKYVLHNRFLPSISPRSIPPPDIPRGPDNKYSDQWYGRRDAMNSVRPPVVAPIPRHRKPKAKSPCYAKLKDTAAGADLLDFPCPPTPGSSWWFDGHCYFKTVPDVKFTHPPPQPAPAPPCPPPCPPPCRPKKPCPAEPEEEEPPCPPAKLKDPCGGDEEPCPLKPCKVKRAPSPPPKVPPCDPCVPPRKKNLCAEEKYKDKCIQSEPDPCGDDEKRSSDPCGDDSKPSSDPCKKKK